MNSLLFQTASNIFYSTFAKKDGSEAKELKSYKSLVRSTEDNFYVIQAEVGLA